MHLQIVWSCKFKANVNVCSLGDNKCLSLRQWNAHVGILPMWSWSCKTPSIGLMFESPCQTIVYGHVSGNGRGHTMWPPPSGNRKLPSCWQGASRREVRQLVLALHQAGGQACSTLIVGILTSWIESQVLNNILPQCRSTDIRPCLMWRMSARPLGFPSLLGMIKSCFSTYL